MGQAKDHLVRNVGIAAGAITVLILALIVVPDLLRDKWEQNNSERVVAKLKEADAFQKSDPFAAYKIYDEVLKEAQKHKVADELFSKTLADAEKSRTTLYPKVQAQIRAEEAEKQRLAEEEARRAAAEKQRLAEEEERKRASEAQKIAAEKHAASQAVGTVWNSPYSADYKVASWANRAVIKTTVNGPAAKLAVILTDPNGKSVASIIEKDRMISNSYEVETQMEKIQEGTWILSVKTIDPEKVVWQKKSSSHRLNWR